MTEQEIAGLVEKQRQFFRSGATLNVNFRRTQLCRLYDCIQARESQICQALMADLGKSGFESYMCEIGMTLAEISYMRRHINSFVKAKRVKTPLAQFPARSFCQPIPYGNTLIISPWNYPVLLSLEPLVSAIAAGNTAIVKPSAYAPETSRVLEEIVKQCFEPEYITVITGGREENQALLQQKFDFIFFTGSQTVGKEVLRRAAEHLTPVVLELGGKSPCIVDETADIPLAAKRIVFGKFLNCGQTCVAPDYILCHSSVRAALISELSKQIQAQFGEQPLENPNYGRIVNEKHFNRLCGLICEDKVVFGGEVRKDKLKISPTVMDGVTAEDTVMKEEIFGPILPVMEYDSFEKLMKVLKETEKPLALYLFSHNKSHIRTVTSSLSYGGGCINDVIIHLATSEMGFGGVGESGMGSYHGKAGFDAFSHDKSIVDKKTWLDLPMRYQPYGNCVFERLLRYFLR